MPRLMLASVILAAPLVSCHSLRTAPAPAPGGPAGPGAPLPPATNVVTNFDKKWRPLPSQGYDERSKPKWVEHVDFDTQVGDWMTERPRKQGEVNEGDSTTRACKEHPEHLWCQLWLKDQMPAEVKTIVKKVVKVVKVGDKEVAAKEDVAVEKKSSKDHKTVQDHVGDLKKHLDKGLKEGKKHLDKGAAHAKDGADAVGKGTEKGAQDAKKGADEALKGLPEGKSAKGLPDGPKAELPPGMANNLTSLW